MELFRTLRLVHQHESTLLSAYEIEQPPPPLGWLSSGT
jgi:hypothetical protein